MKEQTTDSGACAPVSAQSKSSASYREESGELWVSPGRVLSRPSDGYVLSLPSDGEVLSVPEDGEVVERDVSLPDERSSSPGRGRGVREPDGVSDVGEDASGELVDRLPVARFVLVGLFMSRSFWLSRVRSLPDRVSEPDEAAVSLPVVLLLFDMVPLLGLLRLVSPAGCDVLYPLSVDELPGVVV